MFSYLDLVLFPNQCTVLEIVPLTRYVYPIFKNGSSSLNASGYRKLSITEISALTNVEIYVRDPVERFASAVRTYLNILDPKLDQYTALHFVTEYLFLDRHLCPQFYWLLNLQRYTNATITILPLHNLNTIAPARLNVGTIDSSLIDKLRQDIRIQFYLEIDKVLTELLLNKTVSFNDIIKAIQTNYPEVYTDIISRSLDIMSYVNLKSD